MMRLHSQAITTTKISAALQASKEPVSTLAKRYGVSELSIVKVQK
ncbi:MAG: hypothetical protein ACTS73_06635 [Arsenophonus sp. NEOnobi-MAG3]